MELSRRDAIAALAATGTAVGAGAGFTLLRDDSVDTTAPLDGQTVTTLVACAEVLYPSAVENVEPFIKQYAAGRAEDRPERAREIADAVDYLDEYVDEWAPIPPIRPLTARTLSESGITWLMSYSWHCIPLRQVVNSSVSRIRRDMLGDSKATRGAHNDKFDTHRR